MSKKAAVGSMKLRHILEWVLLPNKRKQKQVSSLLSNALGKWQTLVNMNGLGLYTSGIGKSLKASFQERK